MATGAVVVAPDGSARRDLSCFVLSCMRSVSVFFAFSARVYSCDWRSDLGEYRGSKTILELVLQCTAVAESWVWKQDHTV